MIPDRDAKVDNRDRRISLQFYREEISVRLGWATGEVSKCVRYGCSLSPLLFKLYIQDQRKELAGVG